MELLTVGISLIVIVANFLFSKSDIVEQVNTPENTSEVESAIIVDIPSPTPEATQKPVSTSSPTSSKADDFIYPGATIMSNANGEIKLESNDDPDKITEWYEEKISSIGLGSKSFVKTNSSSNILNKLSAKGDDKSVAVTIEKNAGKQQTNINISLDNQ